MANSYLTVAEFFQHHDARTSLQASGDQNSPSGNATNLQAVIDAAAGEVETVLSGRVPSLPVTASAFLKGLIADLAVQRLFLRRPGAPKELIAAGERARQWLADFRDGLVALPGVDRACPRVEDSEYTDGKSRWDHVYGLPVSETGPSRGQ